MLFFIWADEKYNTQKNPCVVFATQKNPSVFHRPKKIPFGQNFRPKKILRTPPSLKYVSGAPGFSAFSALKSKAFRLREVLIQHDTLHWGDRLGSSHAFVTRESWTSHQ